MCYFLLAGSFGACRQAGPAQPPPRTAPPESQSTAQPDPAEPEPAEDPVGSLPLPTPARDAQQWLFVDRARAGSDGGWATGSFDPDRNKIDIETQDVDVFSIDVSRIPIEWGRIVIIGINGRNSELRRRDYDVYVFEHDGTDWTVVEP